MRTLVTGTTSGLGRYLYTAMGGLKFVRNAHAENRTATLDTEYDVIIHCAFNATTNVDYIKMPGYLDDMVGLTERLTELSHRVFVFISTVDVYPQDNSVHTEDELLCLHTPRTGYAACKLLSEAIVMERCREFIILRPTTLLGIHARMNNLMRVLSDDQSPLTLSAESEFNCVLHEDVSEFIQTCLADGHRGVFNLASSGESVRLAEVATRWGRNPQFGNFVYRCVRVDNGKAKSILPAFRNTTWNVIQQFSKRWPER